MTCQALLETLAKAGVATAVVAFGSGASVVKPFEMHHQRANALLSGIYDGGGTNDYFAVRYAHKMLMNRPEQRKICFVITDGQGNSQGTRDQIKVGERLGITTIGIGIQLSLSMTYDQSVTVNKPSDLGIVSFKQIKLAAA
jgi:Mg-chelatase subunit ChlD